MTQGLAKQSLGMRTLAVHAGQEPDAMTGAIATPVITTSSYSYEDFDTGVRRFNGQQPGYLYSRFANPTVAVLEKKMAILESGEAAVGCASGMAAISATLMALLSAGDEIIHVGTLYGGTEGVIRTLLPRFGIIPRYVADIEDLPAAINDQTKVVYVETPANPVLGIVDLAGIARIAKAAGIISVADNTFATPCITRPLELGIDVVVHSATKYISGHGDATGGVAVGSHIIIEKIRTLGMKQFGGCLSPHEAAMLIRGLKTLPLRIEACSLSAQKIAESIATHPAVSQVFYPGLESHKGHEVARRQMQLFGGILAIELRGGQPAARTFLDSLVLVTQAVSVGDTDSLACHPATTTHSTVAPDVRLRCGVSDGLVRLSIGIEDSKDLLEDIHRALDCAQDNL